jgi:hypothetical protein
MIGISTQTYDLDGARIFRNPEDLKNRRGERRVSRTGTLDGGVVITDLGFADGDRTILVNEPNASLASVDFARYLVEHYSLVNVMTEDGAYSAVPSAYDVSNGELSLTMLVSEKLSD